MMHVRFSLSLALANGKAVVQFRHVDDASCPRLIQAAGVERAFVDGVAGLPRRPRGLAGGERLPLRNGNFVVDVGAAAGDARG